MSELDDLEATKKKIKLAERKQDAAFLQQVIEPLAEAIEELKDEIKKSREAELEENKKEKPSTEYFDKGLSPQVSAGIDKISLLIQKLKPVDLSPIKDIADSINRRSDDVAKSLLALSKVTTDTSGYERLFKDVMVMIQRNNEFLSAGIKQFDYTKQFNSIQDSLQKILTREITSVSTIERSRYGNMPIEKVTTISTSK